MEIVPKGIAECQEVLHHFENNVSPRSASDQNTWSHEWRNFSKTKKKQKSFEYHFTGESESSFFFFLFFFLKEEEAKYTKACESVRTDTAAQTPRH